MQTRVVSSHPKKKSRRKLVLQKDDDDEEMTNIDDNRKLKVERHRHPTSVDEICQNIKIIGGLAGFNLIKFERLRKDDKENIEEAMIEMICTFKMTPL